LPFFKAQNSPVDPSNEVHSELWFVVTRGWAAASRLGQIFFKLFQRLVDALAVGVSDTAIAADKRS
jgi:hypothetical protein